MNFAIRRLQPGLLLTGVLAVAALTLARIPGLAHLGPLTLALILALAWGAFAKVPPQTGPGIGFAAKVLLRAGIVLLGVRLNLDLILHAGVRILLIDVTVITAGLVGITWLGRRLGLDPTLACLIAVDSSICGASAVAAAAPTLRAHEHETALVIPMCSMIGTAAVLGFTALQHLAPLSASHFGLLSGATLPEVAQVMATVSPVPNAIEVGTVTKLTRVVLLVPVVFLLGLWTSRRSEQRAPTAGMKKPWFVAGFLLVGIINTAGLRLLPRWNAPIVSLDGHLLDIAGVLMTMAMAGMGLQVDFARLRENGLRAFATAAIGWCGLAALAAVDIALIGN